MKKTLVIVINVENKRESYYQYMDLLLKCLERNIEKIFTCTNHNKLRYYVHKQDVIAKRNFQALANTIEKKLENGGLPFMTGLSEELSDINKLILYFRLHIDAGSESDSIAENEIVNLQYYFLIKQYIEQENRGANMPILCQLLIDDIGLKKTRYKLSQFLLFESKKETPVFLRSNSAQSVSTYGYAVNLPGIGQDSTYGITSLSRFCPLLEISEETYNLLSGSVETVLKKCSGKSGKMPIRSFKNYMDAEMNVENILVDMCVYYFTEGSNKEEKKKREDFFYSPEFRNEIKGMTLLSFFILCSFEYYLIELYKETEQEEMELSISDLQKKINTANNLSSGLIQIIENVVAHTKYRKGYFCFRIHRKDSDYLYRNYKAYLTQVCEKIQCSMFMEVKVSDLSLDIHESPYSSIIAEQFMKNLSERQIAEPELETIYHDFQNITVKDFYLTDQTKDEYKEVWRRYYSIQKNWLYHYGLKLYARVVEKANGFFEVNSKNSLKKVNNGQYYSTLEIDADDTEYLPGTQYSIVLPYLLDRTAQKHIGIDSEIEYDEMLKMLLQGKIVYNHEDIKIHDLIRNQIKSKEGICTKNLRTEFSNLQTNKEKYTKEVETIIKEEYEKCFASYAESVDVIKTIILDVGNLENSFWQEIVAKAVWKYICNDSRENSFYCSLDNCSFEFIQYLTNTIAIYFGLNPNHRVEKEYQLYICNAQSEEDFLISGCNLLEIRSRAYKFAASRGLFPHALTYLFLDLGERTVQIEPRTNSLKVIPFDLLIKRDGEVLFTKLIKSVMEKEIYNPDYGCKLPNIHIRLGSKIHIRNFYEAEILFQDSYFSKRMAYFVVDDIMKKIKERPSAESKHLVLIGYENYSETFIYDVHKFLKERLKDENLSYFLENYAVCFDINGALEFVGLDDSVPDEDLEFIIIVSLNSTLTTHNKIKAALEKQKKIKQGSSNIFANYSVMLLRDDYIDKTKIKNPDPTYMTSIEKKFWLEIDDTKKIVKSRYVDKEIKYFISEVTGWNDPLSCPMCFPSDSTVKEQALIDTNKISIIPTFQYGLVRKPSDTTWIATVTKQKKKMKIAQKVKDWDSEDEDNQKKLNWLADNVKYGHIKRNDNHFLFYFDTKKLFDDCKEELKKWLEKISLNETKSTERKEQGYFGVYNILVTPSHESNTGFIELINDCIFKNAAYIVRFDINKMYRNNLVARYSNLTLLYRRIIETAKEIGGQAKINLYYVDDTIVSGKTFERAASLMKSLYRETKENMNGLSEAVEINIFEGCFLLLNRLSTESVKGLAGENCKYYSYFDVPISLIRNHEDFCFMCNLIENAHQLCVKSSTNEIAQRWNNVEERFQLKEYYSFIEDGNKKERYRKRFYATYWSSLELKRLGEDAENTEQVSRMIVERLLVKNMWPYGKTEISDSNKLEVLFSYIKVLSRPFFNSNWRNREAIFSLILIFLEVLLNKKVKSQKAYKDIVYEFVYLEDIEGIFKICNLINRYSNVSQKTTIQDLILMHNMLMVFVKQAMELNSNYIIRKENIVRIVNKNREIVEKLNKLEGKAEWDDRYEKTVKSIRNFESTLIIYVKQLISLSGDEKKSIWLEKLLLTGNEYISEVVENDEEFINEYGLNSCLGRGLYIENTSAIKEAFDDIGREILVDIKNEEEKGRDDAQAEMSQEMSLLQMKEIEMIIKQKLNEIFQSKDRYYLKSFYEILQIHGYAKTKDDTVEVYEECFAMLQEVMKLYVLLTWKRNHTGGLEKFYMNMMICFASILGSAKVQCQILMPENNVKRDRLKAYCLLEIGKREGASYTLKKGESQLLLQGIDIKEKIRQEGTLKTFSFIAEKYLVLTFESDTEVAEGRQNKNNLEKPMFLRPLYFVFDISGQKEEDVVKKLRFILTMRTDIVKNLERDFKDNSFQEMIEEKNKKIQLSEWKNATHSDGWIYSDILKSMSENREIKEEQKLEKYVKTLEGAVLRLLSDSNISSKYHAILTEELEHRYAVGKKGIRVTNMDFDKCIVSLYQDSLKDMPQENKKDIMCKGIYINESMRNKKIIYFSAEQEQGMLIVIPILQNALKHCAYNGAVEIYCGDKAEFSMEKEQKKKELYYLCIDNPIANTKEVSEEELNEFINHPIGMRKLEHSGRKNGISLYAVNKYLERLIEIYYGEKVDFTEPALKVKKNGNYMSVKLPIIISEK